jgi:hypothetical protein
VLELFIHTLYFSVNPSNYFNSDSSPMTLQSVGICVSEYRFMKLLLFLSRPTLCVDFTQADVDSTCLHCAAGTRGSRKNSKRGILLENRTESPPSSGILQMSIFSQRAHSATFLNPNFWYTGSYCRCSLIRSTIKLLTPNPTHLLTTFASIGFRLSSSGE